MGALQAGHVVVAGAHPLERVGISVVLDKALGHEPMLEASSYAQLQGALEDGCALLVLDHELPGLRPLQHIREIRMAFPATKVVVVAAHGGMETVLSVLSCGAHGFVPKTLPPADMAEAFRMIMAGHVFVPGEICEVARIAKVRGSAGPASFDARLSDRQRQVLSLACEGNSNKEIARRLRIAEATVKVHISAAYRAIGVHSRGRAAAFYRDHLQPQGSLRLSA